MAEVTGGTLESISDTSINDLEEHLTIARPPCRRSTVIDDEDEGISDTSSDCDGDRFAKNHSGIVDVAMSVAGSSSTPAESLCEVLKSDLSTDVIEGDDRADRPSEALRSSSGVALFPSPHSTDEAVSSVGKVVGPFTSVAQRPRSSSYLELLSPSILSAPETSTMEDSTVLTSDPFQEVIPSFQEVIVPATDRTIAQHLPPQNELGSISVAGVVMTVDTEQLATSDKCEAMKLSKGPFSRLVEAVPPADQVSNAAMNPTSIAVTAVELPTAIDKSRAPISITAEKAESTPINTIASAIVTVKVEASVAAAAVRVTAPAVAVVKVTAPAAAAVNVTAPAAAVVRVTAPAVAVVKVTAPAVAVVKVTAPAAAAVKVTAPAAAVVRVTAPATAAVRVVLKAAPDPATTMAAPSLSIRARSGSVDLTNEKNRVGHSHSAISSSVSCSTSSRSIIRSVGSSSVVEEKETAERWRDRLWPSRALTSFCRSITRCTPPILEAGKNIFAQKGQNGEKKVVLVPHWNKIDMKTVITSYDTLAAHNAAFFLLLVEESRESSLQDSSEFESVRKPCVQDNHGWASAEVLQVVSEMKVPVSTTTSQLLSQQPYRSQSDPRLGSVWVVRLALSEYVKSAGPDRNGNKNYYDPVMSDFFAGGDLLLLHCKGLSRPLLGIVQIWDPDFESKFGGSVKNGGGGSSKGHLVDAGGRDTVNLLLCVDSGCGVSGDNDLGGWAPQGLIVPGLIISGMCSLGNVVTSIRECQALMSLRSLSKSLQEVVLCGGSKGMQYATAYGGKGKEDTSNDGTAGPKTSSVCDASNSVRHNKPEFKPMVYSSEQLSCPETLPAALWTALSSQYNSSQLRAIHAVCLTTPALPLNSDGTSKPPIPSAAASTNATVTLLQGPPGTGKTRTVLAIVAALLAGGGSAQRRTGSKVIAGASLRNPTAASSSSSSMAANSAAAPGKKIRVLVCAPSNTAVDELAFRLHTQGVLGPDGRRQGDLSVVRIGMVGGRKEKDGEAAGGRRGSSGAALETNQMASVVEKLSLDYLVDEKRRGMYNEYGGFAEERGGSGQRAPNIMDIRKQILEKADVVCCTLSGAGSQPILEVVMRIPGFKFDAVIIDEAAQAVEPSTLIPFKFNPHRVVMVGDPCQLPATVFSRVAKDANYDQSLFQRLHLAGYPVMMLETQYRMHKAIAEYPSERFYEGKLRTDRLVAESGSHDKPYHLDPSGKFRPVVLHNVAYGTMTTEGNSISNRDEALYVVGLYESLYELYPSYRAGVGIIAPYKSQRRLLKGLFRDRFGPSMGNVEISTIDGFQGREKEIVIFSCVRAPSSNRHGNYSGGIGFLKEWQRLNVAITRAKYAVWIVGHAETLGSDQEWKHLIEFSKEKSYFLEVPVPLSKKDWQGKNKNNNRNTNNTQPNKKKNRQNRNNVANDSKDVIAKPDDKSSTSMTDGDIGHQNSSSTISSNPVIDQIMSVIDSSSKGSREDNAPPLDPVVIPIPQVVIKREREDPPILIKSEHPAMPQPLPLSGPFSSHIPAEESSPKKQKITPTLASVPDSL